MAGGCVSVAVQLAGHIAAVVFHGNNAAGHGQRVADCGIVGVVSGGITVLCGNIRITVHGESDGLSLVILILRQGELVGRPAVKYIALRDQVLVQRHGHFCAVRYRVGLLAGGCVSAAQLAGHIAAVVFHSNSAAGHGQRVAVQSIGVELPTGIEGDVIRNCGFFHIKLAIFGLAIFGGVPADELVTRTFGSIDGIQIGCIQIVCYGLSDFFGRINRHLSVVGQVIGQVVGQVAGQVAAIGIKGHLAEVKKIAVFQFTIVIIKVPTVIIVCKQIFCVVPVVVVVDDTISRTISQTGFERLKSSREYNAFQMGATFKGFAIVNILTVPVFNFFYIFRDGDLAQVGAMPKGTPADRLNILT